MPKSTNSVLVIDDEPQIRRFVGAGLELHGYTVKEADTGAVGLSTAAHMQPLRPILFPIGSQNLLARREWMLHLAGEHPTSQNARPCRCSTHRGHFPLSQPSQTGYTGSKRDRLTSASANRPIYTR